MNLFSHPVYGYWMVTVAVPAAVGLLWTLLVAVTLSRLSPDQLLPAWCRCHPLVTYKSGSVPYVMTKALKLSRRDVPLAAVLVLFSGPILMAIAFVGLAAAILYADLRRAQ